MSCDDPARAKPHRVTCGRILAEATYRRPPVPVVISSSQRTTRLLIEFHIEPIGHLDYCCPAAYQSACLDIPSGGRKASHKRYYETCQVDTLDHTHYFLYQHNQLPHIPIKPA